ncbi:hypothetical protein ACRAWF_31445 [Streptomyces sp. L7]
MTGEVADRPRLRIGRLDPRTIPAGTGDAVTRSPRLAGTARRRCPSPPITAGTSARRYGPTSWTPHLPDPPGRRRPQVARLPPRPPGPAHRSHSGRRPRGQPRRLAHRRLLTAHGTPSPPAWPRRPRTDSSPGARAGNIRPAAPPSDRPSRRPSARHSPPTGALPLPPRRRPPPSPPDNTAPALSVRASGATPDKGRPCRSRRLGLDGHARTRRTPPHEGRTHPRGPRRGRTGPPGVTVTRSCHVGTADALTAQPLRHCNPTFTAPSAAPRPCPGQGFSGDFLTPARLRHPGDI